MFHILVFYFLWLFGEVYLKAHHFRLAWHVARGQEAVRLRTHTTQRTAMYLAAPSHLFVAPMWLETSGNINQLEHLGTSWNHGESWSFHRITWLSWFSRRFSSKTSIHSEVFSWQRWRSFHLRPLWSLDALRGALPSHIFGAHSAGAGTAGGSERLGHRGRPGVFQHHVGHGLSQRTGES